MELLQIPFFLVSLAVFLSAPNVAPAREGDWEMDDTLFIRHLLEDSRAQMVKPLSHGYMSNTELKEAITEFGQRCSHISHIYSIGKSVKGFPLLVIEISDRPGQEEAEPSFKVSYICQAHFLQSQFLLLEIFMVMNLLDENYSYTLLIGSAATI
ncbi:hypothetical protein KSP39_PZI024462 [Platanthera zijinensis]|uniref:Peptidase M14 domain-containing protein n=1 Tax=Platanthera zijinensis TaxID=2320716 RepID=A0AAP0FTB2_9ASPA